MMTTPERIRRRQHHIQIAQLVAYVAIIALLGYVFTGFQERDRDICDTARENRMASRNIVVSIHRLGKQLVLDGDKGVEPTPEQEAALDQFKEFKKQQLALLKDPACSGHEDEEGE